VPAILGLRGQHPARYALTYDHEELVRDIKGCPPYTDFTPRFDWKKIDPTKGDTAGYIAKSLSVPRTAG